MVSRAYVEITNICNMHCSFCHGHSRTPHRMSVEEFSYILDELEGKIQFVYYHLMGEPLTHPRLPDMIRLANARGFRSVITTNGTLLPQKGDALIAAAPHKVSISLHSFEEGGDDAMYQYLSETADFAAKAAEAGIIVVFRLWNRGCDCGQNERIEAFLRARLPGDWVISPRGARIRERLYMEWGDRFVWPDKDAPDEGSEVFCYGLGNQFGILCDGTVVPCCLDSDGVINLGNVFTEPLADILASPRATAMVEGFRRRCVTEDLCRRCGYARRF